MARFVRRSWTGSEGGLGSYPTPAATARCPAPKGALRSGVAGQPPRPVRSSPALPLLILALAACTRGPTSAAPGPLILLVSFDTTRADALGCYGGEAARTPILDGLAARGVRFAWALAQSPTTLASHASALSGLDAHGHRVVRNGFPVTDDIPLVQERIQAEGWQTRAVIGSFALEGGMGLSRGFDDYADRGWLKHLGEYAFPADQVTDRALASARAADPQRPLFLFVHYYDPHQSWNRAPAELVSTFVDPHYAGIAAGDPAGIGRLTAAAQDGSLRPEDARQARALYLAEVAWTDQQLGRLLAGLEADGRLADSLVLMMSDHGEVLDEIPDRPYRHGPDADLAALHVPLLVAGRGRYATPPGRVVSELVRVQDVAATLAQAAGASPDLGDSRDLSVTWTAGAAPLAPLPAFAEANRPHELATGPGWPNLRMERSVALDGLLLTRAPYLAEEGLFSLAEGQPAHVDPDAQARLGALLDAWDAAAPGARSADLDPETRAALKALGYVDGD